MNDFSRVPFSVPQCEQKPEQSDKKIATRGKVSGKRDESLALCTSYATRMLNEGGRNYERERR